MDKQWSEMTPEEKREQRFQWMLSPDGISFPSAEAEQAYKKRIQALIDVYHVREPEVVPVNLPIGNLPFAAAGVTYHDLMYEPGKARAAAAKFTAETGLDAPLGVSALPGRVLDLLDYKLYNWPGHGLGVNAPGYQFNEGEYMTADEYDQLIRDPSNFWTRVYFPRIFGALEPFRLLQPVTDVTEIVQVVSHFAPFARMRAIRDAVGSASSQLPISLAIAISASVGSKASRSLLPALPRSVMSMLGRARTNFWKSSSDSPSATLSAISRLAGVMRPAPMALSTRCTASMWCTFWRSSRSSRFLSMSVAMMRWFASESSRRRFRTSSLPGGSWSLSAPFSSVICV